METIEKIKKLKDESGLTAAQLSEKSGVPLGTLNRILSGKQKSVKSDTLKSLATALGTTIKYLSSDERSDGETQVKDYGFVRVGAVTPRVCVGNVEKNADEVKRALAAASDKKVGVLVFPELYLTGYTLSDLFYNNLLSEKVEKSLIDIINFSENYETLFALGFPFFTSGKLYNCAAVICGGKLLGIVPKTFIPNYNEFYERRQFSPAPKDNRQVFYCNQSVPFGTNLLFENEKQKDCVVAVEICEDLWAANSPSLRHAENGATLVLNLSASDELIGKAEYRRSLVSSHSAKAVCAYAYSDAGDGESSTDMVFAGHNIISENGKILAESKLFENGLIFADADLSYINFERKKLFNYVSQDLSGYERISFSLSALGDDFCREYHKTPFVPSSGDELDDRIDLILNVQAQGLKTRVEKINCKTLVLGLSGGLDSTLALLVAVKTIDKLHRSRKDIVAVTMPCFGTTSRTKNNSVLLANALGVTLKEVDITQSVLSHFADIGQDKSITDVTYENSQARERTQVLMDIANKSGGIVIGTGDLSELALGWATYNGDHMSMYGVNASVPKTLVRYIVKHVADRSDEKTASVLYDILNTPVSPELIPAVNGEISQKTEDIVGPYELHDFYLYYFVRAGFSPSKIYAIAKRTFSDAYTDEVIYKWLKTFVKRFFAQQFKRSCLPDGVKVGSVSLSPRGDWRMPSDAYEDLWLSDLENSK